ncbi:hypothetical protein CAI21_04080 [Alkalilimnicola ehrlichii]|uniref:PAS domain S-box protein n=1 Tax=Alkalilimnicola ehrlichii TaxID=351052 RepID=UPI000E2FE772|nr:PAS domain S-box protein [Alkalilimnicola ehrlichii]RFA30698.1 hypothetical protein CAI21_04080 [Alkalilimnicola ehrlichii]
MPLLSFLRPPSRWLRHFRSLFASPLSDQALRLFSVRLLAERSPNRVRALLVEAVLLLIGAKSACLLMGTTSGPQVMSRGERYGRDAWAMLDNRPCTDWQEAQFRKAKQRWQPWLSGHGQVCLPLWKRGELLGLFLFEVPGAGARLLEVLSLRQLSYVAAVALDNARWTERMHCVSDLYGRMLATAQEGVWLSNEQDITTFVNRRMASMLGYRIEEMVGRSVLDFVAPDLRQHAADALQRERSGTVERHDFRLWHKRQYPVWAMFTSVALLTNDGTYQGSLAMVTDISERKRAEAALRASEAKYRNLVETSRDLIWSVDIEGRFTFVNNASHRILGYKPEEMIGRHYAKFVDPDHVAKDAEVWEYLKQGRSFTRYNTVYRRKDNSRVSLSFSTSMLSDEQGHPIAAAGTAVDLTPLEEADEAIRDRESRLRSLLEQLPAIVWTTDMDTRLVSVQGSQLHYIDTDLTQAVGQTGAEILGNEDDPLLNLIKRALKGESGSIEGRWFGRVSQAHVEPLKDAQGVIIGSLGVSLDITELRRSQEALFEERERARITLASIADSVVTLGNDGCVTYLNPAAEAATGWSNAEALGKPVETVLRLVDDTNRQPLGQEIYDGLRTGNLSGLHGCSLDRGQGDYVAIEDSIGPIRDRQGRRLGAVLVFHDVSRSRALAAELSYRATHDALTDLPTAACCSIGCK